MVKNVHCAALLLQLGNKVSCPGSAVYNSSVTSYFSLQESELRPRCIVSPTTAQDVSRAVRSLSHTILACDASGGNDECAFAIRSGGHSTYAGAANIADGVTIDLQGLNDIHVSHDKSTTSVGPGATWGEVYSKLDGLGLSVAGGRAAQVGVGGLSTGGGISYFGPRYGWTCDTVSNFQVVLADGPIVNANAKENPDLLVALRGGSSNFGIVTRVDLDTFEQGLLWGGQVFSSIDTADDQLKALNNINSADAYDEYASLITSFTYVGGQGAVASNSIIYTKPEENPPVYQDLVKIPSVSSTMRIANLTDISIEQGSFSADGKRQLMIEITHGSTLPMLNATFLNWNDSAADIKDVPGIIWSMSLEPLPPALYARAAKSNSLGLSDRSGALMVTLLSPMWSYEADNVRVEQAAHKMIAGIEADARKLGLYDPYVYLNYAARSQDPIASYGAKSVEKLRRVSKKVDPKGLFKNHLPGGFKIPA